VHWSIPVDHVCGKILVVNPHLKAKLASFAGASIIITLWANVLEQWHKQAL
jgi:hypothetical protein